MQTIPLYRYTRPDGGVTVSLAGPRTGDYTQAARLVADEGKVLTQDGVDLYPAIDVQSAEGWYEVDAPPEPALEPEPTEGPTE